MIDRLKVAVIGAGSAQFLHELADVCALDGIGPYEVAMVDTHPERLETVERLGRLVADRYGVPATITAHLDRAAALDGADAVITSIGVGMQDSIRPDFEIPARYGLRQTVADTVGVGAIVRILRTAPVLADIARDLHRANPEALLLNVTNPMAMSIMALRSLVPEVRSYGLCHSTWMTAATVAELLEIPVEELTFAGAGVNHQVFLTRLEHHGEDVYPRLRALADEDLPFADTVRADMLRRFGYFVTESSKHNAEYVPWYLPWDDQVSRFGLPVNPYEERKQDNERWFGFATEVAAGRMELPDGLVPSGEYAPQILRSLVDGERRSLFVNVPNDDGVGGRWVDELPAWGAVEVPGHCDGNGVHPHRAEPIPPVCAAINRRSLDVCDLAVRAVVEGRRDYVVHAAMLDANASTTMPPDRIEAMVHDMLDAHQQAGWLPKELWR